MLGMLQRVQSHLDTPTALKNPAKVDERAEPQRAMVSMRSHAKLTSAGTVQVCHQLSTLLNVLPPLSPSCHQAHCHTHILTQRTLQSSLFLYKATCILAGQPNPRIRRRMDADVCKQNTFSCMHTECDPSKGNITKLARFLFLIPIAKVTHTHTSTDTRTHTHKQ